MLALLCSKCRTIIKEGYQFTPEEIGACSGNYYLSPQYCEQCKLIEDERNTR